MISLSDILPAEGVTMLRVKIRSCVEGAKRSLRMETTATSKFQTPPSRRLAGKKMVLFLISRRQNHERQRLKPLFVPQSHTTNDDS